MTPSNQRLRIYQPATYRIRVQGRLDRSWADYLQGLTIRVDRRPGAHPVTTLTGEVGDQAALVGVLNHLYALGFPLLEVECLKIIKKGDHS